MTNKERCRLKQRLVGAQSKVFRLRLDLQEAEHQAALLQREYECNDLRSLMDLTQAEQAALRGSSVIDTIKMVRARTGLGLKEAKDIVDRYRESL